MSQNPGRRAALTDAAVAILAREGARGLTFRAIDAEAELPTGTTKNYFANRGALLAHVAASVRDRVRVDGAPASKRGRRASGRDALASAMRRQFRQIEHDRTGYLALFELRLEATKRPEIRDALAALVREEFAAQADEYAGSDLPGEHIDATLLYLVMLGLAVEHLTLPDTLPHSPDAVMDELAARIAATVT